MQYLDLSTDPSHFIFLQLPNPDKAAVEASSTSQLIMTGQVVLEREDHQRDADFSKAMHGKVDANSGFMNIMSKDKKAAGVAAEEYFKHWKDDGTRIETEDEKNVRNSYIV